MLQKGKASVKQLEQYPDINVDLSCVILPSMLEIGSLLSLVCPHWMQIIGNIV